MARQLLDNFALAESDLYCGNAIKEAGGIGKFFQDRTPPALDFKSAESTMLPPNEDLSDNAGGPTCSGVRISDLQRKAAFSSRLLKVLAKASRPHQGGTLAEASTSKHQLPGPFASELGRPT